MLSCLSARLSTKCGVSYCDHSPSVIVCQSVHIFLLTTSPSMDLFLNNLMGMFLRLSCFKVVKIIQLHAELWLLGHQKRGKMPKL